MEKTPKRVERSNLEDEAATVVWGALHGTSAAVYNGSGTPEFVLAASSGRISEFCIEEENAHLYEGINDEDWSAQPATRDD